MSRQRNYHIIMATAKQYYPEVSLPSGIEHPRAFFEGMLSCYFSEGKMYNGTVQRVDIPYKEDTPYYNDWFHGWNTALKYESTYKEKYPVRNSEFKVAV